MIWLYIAVGGGLGAVARYGIGGWVQDRSGFAFPWGTFAVNLRTSGHSRNGSARSCPTSTG
jgi:fluoride ion exporter CrcB/FEX